MPNTLPEDDRRSTIRRYEERLQRYGHSPRTLGWDKGKQDVRFEVLMSQYDFVGKTVLDVGCGFGDMVPFIRETTNDDFKYVGVDLVPGLIEMARNIHHKEQNVEFHCVDFLDPGFNVTADFALGSGLFNFRLAHMDNSQFIEHTLRKAFVLARDGVAFDFLSDKVDYRLEHTHHSSPESVLSMVFGLTRNIVLRNDYMPFEFAVFAFKDQSFAKEDTLFERYKSRRVLGAARQCRK